MSEVFIKGLTFDCIIGIYPEERLHEQPLVLDITFECPGVERAGREGRLDLSIDYAAAAEFARQFCRQRQAELLEELACELADALIARFKPAGVRLVLTKPQAVPGAAGAGIAYSKKA